MFTDIYMQIVACVMSSLLRWYAYGDACLGVMSALSALRCLRTFRVREAGASQRVYLRCQPKLVRCDKTEHARKLQGVQLHYSSPSSCLSYIAGNSSPIALFHHFSPLPK